MVINAKTFNLSQTHKHEQINTLLLTFKNNLKCHSNFEAKTFISYSSKSSNLKWFNLENSFSEMTFKEPIALCIFFFTAIFGQMIKMDLPGPWTIRNSNSSEYETLIYLKNLNFSVLNHFTELVILHIAVYAAQIQNFLENCAS